MNNGEISGQNSPSIEYVANRMGVGGCGKNNMLYIYGGNGCTMVVKTLVVNFGSDTFGNPISQKSLQS